MPITCLGTCEFDASVASATPWPNYLMVASNGFSVVGLPAPPNNNGVNTIIPASPWPPSAGWPGQPPSGGLAMGTLPAQSSSDEDDSTSVSSASRSRSSSHSRHR